MLIQGIEPAEDDAGFRVRQIDVAQVPGGRAEADPLEVAVTGGHLQTHGFEIGGAVGTAERASPLGRKGQPEGLAVRAGPAHVLMLDEGLQGAQAQFGVGLAVIFHLHPGQRGLIECA